MSEHPPLSEVSRIYMKAVVENAQPAKSVASTMGIPQPTANSWIRRAKDRGLLPEGSPRLRNERAVRVADALGVDYDVLVAAVVKHADGALRVLS